MNTPSTRRQTIWDKVVQRVSIETSGCWLWQGPTSGTSGRGRGYPRMCLDGATVAVHRIMWIIQNGPLPPKKQLDHLCRNRLCVNPEHLEMVTHRENQKRRDAAK